MQSGITLVALVITIVILIILATISINAIFGENGLVKNAEYGKFEQEKAEAQERLSLVLADAYTEKMTTTEMTQEEFLANELDTFVKKQEPNANIFNEEGKDYISLNGYIFVLNRSVPELGEYDGTEANRPPRIYSINVDNKTFTEITVSVRARMPEGATLRYSIKKLAEKDTAYTQVEEKEELTNTFEGLTSPETYTIRVELLVDEEVQHTLTTNVRLGEYEKGTIEFGPVKWKGIGTASTTITTSTSYQLQYQIVSEENEPTDGGWHNISNGGTIQNIQNKSSVYGRLVEGTNTSDYAILVVKDEIKPTINSFEAIETTWNSITVQAVATDNESGLASTNTYKFYLNEETEAKETSTDGTFTYEKLSGLTSYKLRVEVYDNAGNKEENSINVTTKEATPDEVLDISDNQKIYVEIPSKKGGTILCNVLYNDETNGLQIISVNSVETVTLSGIDTYNDLINILNKKAEEYNYYGNDYVEARCVGCRPVKDEVLGYESGTGETNWGGLTIKKEDTNYKTDYNKMLALGIAKSNASYWLASRKLEEMYSFAGFYVRYISSIEELLYDYLGFVDTSGYTEADSHNGAFRPVFILKSGIKITGGNGTENSPYTLGI